MKVLQVSKTPRGASFALRQSIELAKLGIDVEVALPDGGPMVKKFQQAGLKTHIVDLSLPTRAPWKIPAVSRVARELVDRVQPDIIHSHFVSTTLLLRLALKGHSQVPRLFQIPGPLHLENAVIKRVEIALAGDRDYWMGSCEYTNEIYRDAGVSSDRLGLSYYGTYIEDFVDPDHMSREQLGVPEDTFLVGMVGYFYAPRAYLGQKRGIKGHEDLIDALSILRQRGRNVTGLFIGNAWVGAQAYERQVQEMAKEKLGEHAVFAGYVENVYTVYPVMDVAVHPSHSENVGPAVESLLLGVPTIASDVGGVPELVIDGETGYLIKPKSPEQIADAIERVMDDPEKTKKITLAGRERSRNMFDVRNTAKTVAKMYDQIIEREASMS